MKKECIGKIKYSILQFRDKYFKGAATNIMFNENNLLNKTISTLKLRKPLSVLFVFIFNRGAIPYRRTFDSRWYSFFHPNSTLLFSSLIFHIYKGEQLGYNCSFLFNTKNYIVTNEIDITKCSALLHFLLVGSESQKSSNFFRENLSDKLLRDAALYKVAQMFRTRRKCWQTLVARHAIRFVHSFNDEESGTLKLRLRAIPFLGNIEKQHITCYDRSFSKKIAAPTFFNEIHPPRALDKAGNKPYSVRLQNAYAIGGLPLVLGKCSEHFFPEYAETVLKNKKNVYFSRAQGNGKIDFLTITKPTGSIDTAIILTDARSTNYYHWVIDTISRLIPLLENNEYSHYPIVVDAGLHGNMYEALAALVPNREIIKVRLLHSIKIKEAIYPSHICSCREQEFIELRNSIVLADIPRLKTMVKIIKQNMNILPQEPRRKIFLTRGTGSRNCINSAEVTAYLQQSGFESVDCSKLNFSQQVQIFSEAKIIIAPTGAACTNMIFCNSGTQILTLHHGGHEKGIIIWQSLAAVSEVKLSCGFSNEIAPYKPTHQVFHESYTVKMSVLKDFLAHCRDNGVV